MLKKMTTLVLSMIIACTSTLAFADTKKVENGTIITPYTSEKQVSSSISPSETMSLRTVSYFYEYDEKSYEEEVPGKAFRVSDNVVTGPGESATITLTESEENSISWGASLSADAKNFIVGSVDFSVNKSISTQIGHQITCGANRNTYMEAVPFYNISKGTLKIYHGQRLIDTVKVTLKSPAYYQYQLHK